MLSLGGMVANTDTINAAVRGGDVVGAMAGSNPTFGAIYGLSKMDSPTDLTPMINGGIRATSIANAYGQDLAIQQGAPLLGNNFENTKNALSGGPSVSIGFGTHKSETTWTESYISQFNMGQGSMTIKSGRDINLVGTQIQAEGITLDAGQKLNILADADYYKNRSSGAGVSVSYGASGWGFGVSGNHAKTDSTTYTNAGLNAGSGNLILKSGAEMNIIGANLDGKFIDVDAKGLLTVASVQNTSHSKNSSFGVNVNQSNAASMNGSRGSSDRTFTDNLTTILGTEGVRIHSDTGTVVEGALIANATKNADGTLTDHGNLTIETPMLVWKDLEDIDVSKQIGGGINVSGDDGRNTSGTKTFSEIWDDTANVDYRKDETIGVTKATIGNGTINITNPSQQTQDIATLNRDINNVQVITKESETHISITVPVPDSIANPIGNAGGAVANGVVHTAEAAADSIAAIGKAIADAASRGLDTKEAVGDAMDKMSAEERAKLLAASAAEEVLKEGEFQLTPDQEKERKALIAAVNEANGIDLESMSQEEKVNRLTQLSIAYTKQGGLTQAQYDERNAIYATMELDPDYVNYRNKITDQLVANLAKDTTIQEAANHWQRMDPSSRQTIIERVVDLEQNMIGNKLYIPIDVALLGPRTNAIYTPSKDNIVVNILTVGTNAEFYGPKGATKVYADFLTVMGTSTHEGWHGAQDYFASNPSVAASLGLENGINSIKASMQSGMYMRPSDPYYIYRAHLPEVDAWYVGQSVRNDLSNVINNTKSK